jgi:hypothetical protein
MREIWLVMGNDVGGNTGTVVIAAFDNETDAAAWAVASPDRRHNNAFDHRWAGAPFEVEPVDVFESFDEAERAAVRN